MKRLLAAVIVAVTAFSVSCNDLGVSGGGGGGGGGGGINFVRGYAFVRPDDRNIYVADNTDLTQVAALTSNGGNEEPAVSPTGKQVVFVHRDPSGASELDVVSTSGGAVSTVLPADGTHPNLRTPVFSPDGALVVFAYDSGATSRLAIVSVSGQQVADLTSGALSYASPSFLPDGTILAAAGNSPSELTQLERIDPVSGQVSSVINYLGSEVLSVTDRVVASPDGSKAALEGRISTGVTRIFLADLSGGSVIRFTDHPGDPNASDTYPTWVGTNTVAFSSDTGNANQVYTAPVASTMTAGQLTLPAAIMPWFGP